MPPRSSGSGSAPHSSSPVPCGPYSPLCPGMAINAAPSASMSTGSIPADCDASSTNGTPFSRHSAAMRSTGSRKPNTLDTCVQITASAGHASAAANCRTISSPSNKGPSATVSSTPGMACSGRVTALCSYPEMITRPPGFTSVCTAMFSPCVAQEVNTTRAGSVTPNSFAASVRHCRSVSSAARVAG